MTTYAERMANARYLEFANEVVKQAVKDLRRALRQEARGIEVKHHGMSSRYIIGWLMSPVGELYTRGNSGYIVREVLKEYA